MIVFIGINFFVIVIRMIFNRGAPGSAWGGEALSYGSELYVCEVAADIYIYIYIYLYS